jgi:hypothetical protein
MTPLIWLVAMSLPSSGDRRPLPYYYPQAAVLIHDFQKSGPFGFSGSSEEFLENLPFPLDGQNAVP